MKERRRRRIPADKAAAAALGREEGWYSRIPPPEMAWEPCATCGTRARILSAEHKECINCQVQRARQARTGTAGPF